MCHKLLLWQICFCVFQLFFLLPFTFFFHQTQHYTLHQTTPVEGKIILQENISLWLSARHPVSLAAAQPDNACLSIYIHGILILFLCLGWGGEQGWGQGYCECFSSRETDVRPSRLRLGKRPQTTRPQCHIQQPRSFWAFLSFQGLLLPAGAVCAFLLAPAVTWRDDEKTKKNTARRKRDRHVCD